MCLMVVIWRMLKDGVSFRAAYNKGLVVRKEKRFRRATERLEKMKSAYGTEGFLEMVQGLMRPDAEDASLLRRKLHS